MTAALELVEGVSPRRPLYHSPKGLLDFQASPVAEAYTTDGIIPEFGTGTGKTHIAMALGALLFEDDKIDVMLMVGEQGKVADFVRKDFPTYTDLTIAAYHGPRRGRLLDAPPQVLATSYETGRNDICKFTKGGRGVATAGPLTEFLRGKRVLIVFDEVIIKVRNRSAQTYKAWDYLINRVLRKHCPFVRVVGMTAFTMEKHPEDHFNLGRVVCPWYAGTVEAFKREHVASWWMEAPGGPRPNGYKNIAGGQPGDDPDVVPLSKKMAPAIFRASKDDPEIARYFPRMDERPPMLVELSARHRHFLKVVEEVVRERGYGDAVVWNLVRMAAGHPLALARSRGQMAGLIAETVGRQGLHEIGSAKLDRTLEWARRLGDDQGVIFTFYGQSVLPVIESALTNAGFLVSINHGQMTSSERYASKEAFLGGDKQIFLSSDAGARGLNLGCGRGVLEYDPACTYGTHRQRCDRIHRLDSIHSSVTADCLIAVGTPDEDAYDNQLQRHEWTEQVRGEHEATEEEDHDFEVLTSEARRRALARVRALR